MADDPLSSRLTELLRTLKPKDKQPVSAAVLNNWIAQAETKLGPEARGGRLGWLVASSVVIAVLQRVVDADERQLLLLKAARCFSTDSPATHAPPRTSTDWCGLTSTRSWSRSRACCESRGDR